MKNPDVLHEGKYQFFSGNLGSPNLIKSDFTLGGHLGEELTGMSDMNRPVSGAQKTSSRVSLGDIKV